MARKKRVEKHNSNRGRNNDYGVIPLHRKTIPHILPRNVAQEDYLYQLADPKTISYSLLDLQVQVKHFFVRRWVSNHLWKER